VPRPRITINFNYNKFDVSRLTAIVNFIFSLNALPVRGTFDGAFL
jgi:hypothetical protein